MQVPRALLGAALSLRSLRRRSRHHERCASHQSSSHKASRAAARPRCRRRSSERRWRAGRLRCRRLRRTGRRRASAGSNVARRHGRRGGQGGGVGRVHTDGGEGCPCLRAAAHGCDAGLGALSHLWHGCREAGEERGWRRIINQSINQSQCRHTSIPRHGSRVGEAHMAPDETRRTVALVRQGRQRPRVGAGGEIVHGRPLVRGALVASVHIVHAAQALRPKEGNTRPVGMCAAAGGQSARARGAHADASRRVVELAQTQAQACSPAHVDAVTGGQCVDDVWQRPRGAALRHHAALGAAQRRPGFAPRGGGGVDLRRADGSAGWGEGWVGAGEAGGVSAPSQLFAVKIPCCRYHACMRASMRSHGPAERPRTRWR